MREDMGRMTSCLCGMRDTTMGYRDRSTYTFAKPKSLANITYPALQPDTQPPHLVSPEKYSL